MWPLGRANGLGAPATAVPRCHRRPRAPHAALPALQEAAGGSH